MDGAEAEVETQCEINSVLCSGAYAYSYVLDNIQLRVMFLYSY